MYRDLTGINESARVPKYVRNKSSSFKLGLATAITIASIALTAGIYKITPDKEKVILNPVNAKIVDKNTEYKNSLYHNKLEN